MKQSGFKNKYSTLKRSGFKTRFVIQTENPTPNLFKFKRRTLKKFREVKGEDKNVMQVAEADSKFSKMIRQRDKQCVSCGSSMFLGCSHYIGRSNYATRFDPTNCVTLCQECHQIWENEKKGIYRDFMHMWLGEEGLVMLELQSKVKVSPYESIINFMKINKEVEEEIKY